MDNISGTPPTAAAQSAALEAASLGLEESVKGNAPTRKKSTAKPEQTEPKAKSRASDGFPVHSGLSGKRAEITLHDSDRIPPGGQYLGINGIGFLLLPGVRASVPIELLGVLDNAVMTEPVLNDRLQVDGKRDVPRLTYTIHRD
ncbi:hypothetical protein [Pseudomonas mediterranea]|uniref:hypothetical protein n=1 Tax=Pseudomonas mediterranea TaxID=183795 RepID=UPI0006D898CB|nr:hypothetical protein [Pseudomonas mediterranea]